MAYQNIGGGYGHEHQLNDMPSNNVHTPFNHAVPRFPRSDPHSQAYHEDESESALLHHNQGPFNTPFDENELHGSTPGVEGSRYTLSDSYVGDASAGTHPYTNPYENDKAGYVGGQLEDPTAAFGVPGRVPSPYARSETSSTEAWRQRQAPVHASNLRRYATRKVKLVQGSVLSVDYPVPSAIQNAVQAKYRTDLEGGSEEFTHMRCKNRSQIIFQKVANLYRHGCNLRPQ